MIRNIWAVGRNYAEHAQELNNPIPSEPLIFMKAGSTAVFAAEIQLPAWTQDVHHEAELALKLDDNLQPCEYGLALDLTERHIQGRLKKNGHPWTLAKSFPNSCPLSQFHKIEKLSDLEQMTIRLSVNGELRQNSSTGQMLFKIPVLLDFIRNHFPVCPGDLVLTGTPAGVGPLHRGDRVRGELGGELGPLIQHDWLIA